MYQLDVDVFIDGMACRNGQIDEKLMLLMMVQLRAIGKKSGV
jgi:hypothetical protein